MKDFKEAFKWLEKDNKIMWLSRRNKSPFYYTEKNPENHTCTLKLNIFALESHRKQKLGLKELYGNTE